MLLQCRSWFCLLPKLSPCEAQTKTPIRNQEVRAEYLRNVLILDYFLLTHLPTVISHPSTENPAPPCTTPSHENALSPNNSYNHQTAPPHRPTPSQTTTSNHTRPGHPSPSPGTHEQRSCGRRRSRHCSARRIPPRPSACCIGLRERRVASGGLATPCLLCTSHARRSLREDRRGGT